MAELGETDDPRQLVPGDPAALTTVVHSMRSRANELARAGVGLARIDTAAGWRGPAGDAFRERFTGQPDSWLRASDAFAGAADALEAYAGTLTAAQSRAADAVVQWNAAQTATDQARAQLPPGMNGPFDDPGAAGRETARRLLDNARRALAKAGDSAAGIVGSARDEAPEKPTLWSRVKHVGDEVAADLENAGARAVNALASTGNAMVHHPGDVALAAAGALLAEAGVGGEALGAGLDLTGVGAVAGGPIGVVSAAGIVVGATTAGAAAGNLIMHATSDDSVSPLSTDHTADGTGTGSPPTPTVKERAAALGYTSRIPPQRAPFDSHGQAVFSDGDNYITRDVDAHNVSDGWKMFNRRGQRIGTYDENLNRVKD